MQSTPSRFLAPLTRWMQGIALAGFAATSVIAAPATQVAHVELPPPTAQVAPDQWIDPETAGTTAVAPAPEDVPSPAAEPLPAGDGEAAPGGQDPFYCGERKLGTWFYCEAPRPVHKDAPAQAGATPEAYRARLDKIGAQLEELKAKAILEPTTQNIVNYVRYQRQQLDRASTFADVWQRAIWQTPDLDYTLQRPVNNLGKTTWLEQRKNDQETVMANLSDRYGLFFFFSSSCAACDVFSPVLRSLSDKYKLSVLPVSMDGGANRAFPRFVVNKGQYAKMGLEGNQVPALVLFDTYLKKPIPIGYGVMAEDEVMQRIFYLTSVKPGSDY